MKRIVLLILMLAVLIVSCTDNNQNRTEDPPPIGDEEQDVPDEEDNTGDIDNLYWLVGKWTDGTEVYFVKEAEIKKMDDDYYINVASMFNRRFPLAQTDYLPLIFDEDTATAYYDEDGGGNQGNIYLYIDKNNKSFSMKVEETYSNDVTINNITTFDYVLEMIPYKEPEIPYEYSGESGDFHELIIYLQSNIWVSGDSSAEWAFVPSRISLGSGYLYENGKAIGRYSIYEQSDIADNELLIGLDLTSPNESKEGKIIFEDESIKITFSELDEVLNFSLLSEIN